MSRTEVVPPGLKPRNERSQEKMGLVGHATQNVKSSKVKVCVMRNASTDVVI